MKLIWQFKPRMRRLATAVVIVGASAALAEAAVLAEHLGHRGQSQRSELAPGVAFWTSHADDSLPSASKALEGRTEDDSPPPSTF